MIYRAIYRDIPGKYANNVISRQVIGKWCTSFEHGRTDVTYGYRRGRLSTVLTINNIERVNELLKEKLEDYDRVGASILLAGPLTVRLSCHRSHEKQFSVNQERYFVTVSFNWMEFL